MDAEASAELAAEDVDKEQQQHDGHADEHHGHGWVAQLALEVAPQHYPRVAERVGERGHDRVTPCSAWSVSDWAVTWLPVTAKNTSSRSGVWTDSRSTSIRASCSSSSSSR